MLGSTRVWLPLVLFVVVLGVPGGPHHVADASSTQYLITGELGSSGFTPPPRNPRNPMGTLETLDNGSFSLRLNFDEPATPDFERFGFSSDAEPYAADSWSLDLFGADALLASFSQDTNPNSLGFAVFTGEVTGFDSGETIIETGVAPATSGGIDFSSSLISVDFLADELVDVFFTDSLAGLPRDLEFDDGSVRDPATGLRVPVASAALSFATFEDPVLIEDGGNTPPAVSPPGGGVTPDPGNSGGGGQPSAVPSPGAAVGGLLLMLCLITRQLNRTTQRRVATD